LVTDSVNRGTYNFVDSEVSRIGHFFRDVLPYILWGNDETDRQTTTVFERAFGTYDGEIPNPNN